MESELKKEAEERIYQWIIIFTTFLLVILPFSTTFNEALTRVLGNIPPFWIIQNHVSSFMTKILYILLRILGISSYVDGPSLFINSGWIPIRICISWNCIGWQSFVILVLTLFTGLKGSYTIKSKLITIFMGIEGTFIVNLIRILVPTILAYYSGYLPAVLFHDYIGTIITMIWIGIFWWYSFDRVLISNDTTYNNRSVSDLKKDKIKGPESFEYVTRRRG